MSEPERRDGPANSHWNSLPWPFLSVIIPAFNEEERLAGTLTKIVTFVGSQSFLTEVIVVDNASSDLTGKIVADFAARYSFINHLYEARRGKGAAVRTGMLAGKGDYLLISDADLAVPIEEVEKFLPPQCSNYDIAIGSREIEGAARYNEPFHRHLMGRVFNRIVRLLVLPYLRDTQCGFKCFRRHVAQDLFAASKLSGWGFDVEILCIARRRGHRIIEIPVKWYYGKGSKVKAVRDTFHMLTELMTIRGNLKRGTYD